VLSRTADLTRKAWGYGLRALQYPSELPKLLYNTTCRNVHFGESLNLQSIGPWLRSLDIQTIVDIGAHSGEFASAAARMFPDSTIYCFEPQATPYRRLLRRMAEHQRFEAYQVALGNSSGTVSFWKSGFSKASSVLHMADLHSSTFPWSAEQVKTTVPLRRLDDYFASFATNSNVLLKIDVQGYEVKVLEGARRSLSRVDFIIVETSFVDLYDGQGTFAELFDLLRPYAFRFHGCLDVMRSPKDRAILQADLLFVR